MAKASGPISARLVATINARYYPVEVLRTPIVWTANSLVSGSFVLSIRHLIASLKVLSLLCSAIRQMGDLRHPRGGSLLSVWRSKLISIEATSTMT